MKTHAICYGYKYCDDLRSSFVLRMHSELTRLFFLFAPWFQYSVFTFVSFFHNPIWLDLIDRSTQNWISVLALFWCKCLSSYTID